MIPKTMMQFLDKSMQLNPVCANMAFGIETVKSIIRVSLAAGQVVPFYLNLLASDLGKSYLRPIWPLV